MAGAPRIMVLDRDGIVGERRALRRRSRQKRARALRGGRHVARASHPVWPARVDHASAASARASGAARRDGPAGTSACGHRTRRDRPCPARRSRPGRRTPVMKTTSRKPDSVSSVKITPLAASVGAHHLHHADRQRDLEMIEAVVDAVDDAAVGEQRGEATAARLEQVVRAADVQVALVLAGEAGGRQILGGGGAAHRDGDAGAVLRLELCDRPCRCAARIQAVPVAS